ncbi:abortive infection protein [Candidatus Nitrosoglobus terrae]|uniref:Abortive infection protein n=1 Tax=Candidatus Nitrosoglobus terrae TaxID=1630141 RepID=A0A1Q2SNU8_9GAMM|nr:CPBP family intramembrane glutamic endopeptidase [Candidatus Nitrosoglobus terrae]BAW80802.1 abortive infection protein [Candidatus Nitrosoglobus terrae]
MILSLFSPSRFLIFTAIFEGGLAALSLFLGWLTGINPFNYFTISGHALIWAIVGSFPLILFFMLFYRFPIGPLRPIKEFLIKTIAPYLNTCHWYDLLLVALLAGVCEELFFRGFLQLWIESSSGTLMGLLGSNLIFALAHSITKTYALIAGLIGVYLGFLLDVSEQRNLFIPMVVHTLYDFLALIVIVQSSRRRLSNQAYLNK